MARKVRQIQDLVIDEISLVDKGANQHATVTIAKSADGEKENYMDVYDEQGNPLDPDALEIGQVVYDSAGDAYEIQANDEGAEPEMEQEEERELASVGKAFTDPIERRRTGSVEKSFSADSLREELSKALTDRDRDEVITKAFSQIDSLTQAAEIAKRAAEQERDIRLTQEYVEIAKSYDIPDVSAEDLGTVLKACAESLPYEYCEVIGKALAFASDAASELYEEYGAIGGGANSDVLHQVDAMVEGDVSKSGETREEAFARILNENPQAYDEYLAEQRGY